MRAVSIEFKNGKKLEGLLWTWRPEDDFVQAMSEKDGKVRDINLNNVARGIIYSTRVRQDDDPGAEDLLEKAKSEGWQQ